VRVLSAFLLAAAATAAHSGDLYKWADPRTGEIVYSNEPPPASVKSVEQKKIVPSSIQTSNLPYGVQQAVKHNPITLYVTSCGEFCDAARAYLAKRGLPYVEKNPQSAGDAEQFKKLTGGALEVPLLVIGTQTVRGFDEQRYEAMLESAGYPKTPLTALGVRPATPTKVIADSHPAESTAAKTQERVAPKSGTEPSQPMYHQPRASLGDGF
jgi:glutaredoxin